MMQFIRRSSATEQGSTLVYLALILVVLLGFMALAIDVGNLYGQKRRVQNAADAAAVAGAWQLCHQNGSQVTAAAQAYARDNGADDAQVEIDSWKVKVVASKAVETYFAGILGVNQVTVRATAEAGCSQASSACGLWPLAFSKQDWDKLRSRPCGETFYVWSGSGPGDELDCDIYDCDLNGDGVDDVISSVGRAWLDFSNLVTPDYPDPCAQPGWGANELRCTLLNGSGVRVDPPVCIDGDNGVKAGVSGAVDARSGSYAGIALFDGYCSGGGGPAHRKFNVASFGCIQVVGWVQHLELECRQNGGHGGGWPPWWWDWWDWWGGGGHHHPPHCHPYQTKAIAARVACDPTACFSSCGGITGNPPQSGDITGLGLLK